jgi:hypothetical protein
MSLSVKEKREEDGFAQCAGTFVHLRQLEPQRHRQTPSVMSKDAPCPCFGTDKVGLHEMLHLGRVARTGATKLQQDVILIECFYRETYTIPHTVSSLKS